MVWWTTAVSKHFGMLKIAEKTKTGIMYLRTRFHGLAPCKKTNKQNKQWYHCREWQNSKCRWILCGYICLKNYILFMSNFFFFLLMHCTVGIWIKTDSKNLQNSLTKQKIKTFGLKQKYFLKYLNTKVDHSPHRIKNETI